MYGRDLADDLIVQQRSWRWFKVRLFGLISRDTPTAILLTSVDDRPVVRRTSPTEVGAVLEAWSKNGKR